MPSYDEKIKAVSELCEMRDINRQEVERLAFLNQDISEEFDFVPPEEKLASDDEYRMMWKRTFAIDEYLNKRLEFDDEDSKLKAYCTLKGELQLDEFLLVENGGDADKPFITYEYYYEIKIIGTNKNNPTVYMDCLRCWIYETNEQIFTNLTRHLIKNLLPANKQVKYMFGI